MTIRPLLFAFVVPALLGLTPSATLASASDPRVTTLIRQSGAALHVSAMQSVHVVRLEGKVEAVGLSGTGESWNEMGGARTASIFSAPPLGGGSGWDGTDDWTLDQTGLVTVDASDVARAGTISQTFLTNYDLWTRGDGGAVVTWSGEKTDKGQAYDVLTVSAPGSKIPFDVWFDRTTHLPVRMVQAFGPIVATTTFSDYRPVHGLMIPFIVANTNSNGNGSSFSAQTAEVNPPDASARLSKPNSTPHDFSIAGGASETSVPIRLSENHVYIDVMLNGKGPYHFIFDTGGANVVDPAVVKEIGATGGGTMQLSGVGSSTEASSFATIKTLQVGDATVANQVFLVLPVRKGFGLTAGLPVDGLIGYEVLSRFITTFDYAGSRVVFHMPGTYSAPPGADVVPIAQNGTQPQFACGIDAVPAVCTLDTGARDSLSFYTPFMKAHPQVIPAKLTAAGVNGFGVGGPEFGQLGRTQTLSIGKFTLDNVIGDYATQSQGAFATPFLGANVGGGVWKRFTLTLDYTKLTMTLSPDAAFDAPDVWDRSGLFLINHAGVTIIDVRPGTPAAAAGLTKGESIVSIDGTPAATMTLQAVREILIGKPGEIVHLVIKARDGTSRNVDLTLADYV